MHLIRLARAEEALSHVLQYVCELTSWPCHIAPGCALDKYSTDTVSAEACVQVASDTVLDLGALTPKILEVCLFWLRV